MKELIGFDRYSGQKVLEIGCGTATDLLQFARGGASVTGIDLTPRSIEIARRRFQTYGFAADLAVGDSESLSFPDASFDLVYSFGVLHHTPDTQAAIGEVHRVLRPGGRAIVMLYNRRSLYYWLGLIFKQGVLHAELLRSDASAIMSRHVEYSETDARPLVKAYSKTEALDLFRKFSECRVEVRQLTRSELRPFGPLITDHLFQWLSTNFGWNLIITATR
jgi:ubiquinone/menaquinone biosynthesis C-methylase UbiE